MKATTRIRAVTATAPASPDVSGRPGCFCIRQLLRTATLLCTLLLVACGGGDGALEAFGKSFRIGAAPAEISVPAGGTATATLELTCIFNSASIDVSVTNLDALQRSQIVTAPRRANRACDRSTGQVTAGGNRLYEGTVSWPLTVLDSAEPGRYQVEFLAQALQDDGSNIEKTTLVLVVTAPQPGGFTLGTPADVPVREIDPLLARQGAQIPIAITRDGHAGAVDLAVYAVEGVDPIGRERLEIGAPAAIAAGATTATATANYGLLASGPIPRPGERVIVTASGGGVTRSQAVRLRGDTLVPPVPARFAASATSEAVALSWEHDRAAASYRLERASSDDGPFAPLATIAAPAATYRDTGLLANARHVYRLYAVNEHGESAPAQAAATTSSVPVLSVTVHGNGSVRSEPAGIDCGSACSQAHAEGTVVRLIATPGPAHGAGSLTGDPDCSDGVVTMTRSIACAVEFVPLPGSGWQQLGSALTADSGVVPAFSLAIDDDHFGAPVVAYVEAVPRTAPARLHVKRLDGARWQALGAGPLNAGSVTGASDPSVATRLGTPIHVAWSQGDGEQQNIFVARFNGAAWESVGPPGVPLNVVPGSRAVRPSLAFDVDGLPQVAWIEDGAVKWKRFDGTNWVASSLAGDGPAASGAERVRLATTPYAPVLAWLDGPVGNRRLEVTAGQSFNPFGPQVNAPYDAAVTITHFGLRPEDNGAIVLWTQDERPFSVHARRWQDGFWADDGAPPVAIESNLLMSFALARRSLAAAFSLQPPASAPFTAIYQRVAGGWVASPALVTPGAPLRNLELELPGNDAPIVAGSFVNAAGLHELRVYRYFP